MTPHHFLLLDEKDKVTKELETEQSKNELVYIDMSCEGDRYELFWYSKSAVNNVDEVM